MGRKENMQKKLSPLFGGAKLPSFAIFSTLLLLLVLSATTTGARVGGGSRGGGRVSSGGFGGGSRTSGGGRISSGSSSSGGSYRRPSAFAPTAKATYSPTAVRTTTYGRSVVPYRSIRPAVGSSYVVPVIYSPVVYRPVYFSSPVFFYYRPFYFYHVHYYYYNGYYYRSYGTTPRPGSPPPADASPIRIIFSNSAMHCARNPEYGIDGQEEYLITGLSQNDTMANSSATSNSSSTTTAAPVVTSSDCNFSIVGPKDSMLRVIFNSTSCRKWPPNCRIVITDIGDDTTASDDDDSDSSGPMLDANANTVLTSMTFGANNLCTKEVFSESNRIAVNITSCSADSPGHFDYSVGVDVAVAVDGVGLSIFRAPASFYWLNAVLFAFLYTFQTETCK